MLGGEGVNPVINVGLNYCTCTLNKFSQLTFIVPFWVGEGLCKMSTFCTFVKMLKIMDGPLNNYIEAK